MAGLEEILRDILWNDQVVLKAYMKGCFDQAMQENDVEEMPK